MKLLKTASKLGILIMIPRATFLSIVADKPTMLTFWHGNYYPMADKDAESVPSVQNQITVASITQIFKVGLRNKKKKKNLLLKVMDEV